MEVYICPGVGLSSSISKFKSSDGFRPLGSRGAGEILNTGCKNQLYGCMSVFHSTVRSRKLVYIILIGAGFRLNLQIYQIYF